MLRAARAEAPDAGIGTFAAACPKAGPNRENRYAITLACTAPRQATLVIDVYGVDRAGIPAEHVASALKQFQLSPCRPLRVEVRFRWREKATFELDGVLEGADERWEGAPVAAPFVSVAAELRASDGRCLDRTVIFQAIDGHPAVDGPFADGRPGGDSVA